MADLVQTLADPTSHRSDVACTGAELIALARYSRRSPAASAALASALAVALAKHTRIFAGANSASHSTAQDADCARRVLQAIAYVLREGHLGFRSDIHQARPEVAVAARELQTYRMNSDDAIRGDEPARKVRAVAKELVRALYGFDSDSIQSRRDEGVGRSSVAIEKSTLQESAEDVSVPATPHSPHTLAPMSVKSLLALERHAASANTQRVARHHLPPAVALLDFLDSMRAGTLCGLSAFAALGTALSTFVHRPSLQVLCAAAMLEFLLEVEIDVLTCKIEVEQPNSRHLAPPLLLVQPDSCGCIRFERDILKESEKNIPDACGTEPLFDSHSSQQVHSYLTRIANSICQDGSPAESALKKSSSRIVELVQAARTLALSLPALDQTDKASGLTESPGSFLSGLQTTPYDLSADSWQAPG